MKLRLPILLIIALGATLTGCDEGRKTPLRTTVRIINAAPDAALLEYRREQTPPGSITFRSSLHHSYDADTYDFTVTGAGSLLGATFRQSIDGNANYGFVLSQLGGSVYPAVLAIPNLPAGSANSRGLIFHGAENVAPFDFYIVPAGAAHGSNAPIATLSFGQASAAFDRGPGSYELVLTSPSDSSAVQFTSRPFTLAADAYFIMTLTGGGGETPAPFSVLLTRVTTETLYDRNLGTHVRVLNAAADMAPRDVLINDVAPAPFQGVPFTALTAYEPIPAGDYTVAVTPAGNPGVVEGQGTVIDSSPAFQTIFVSGDAGALTVSVVTDSNRRFASSGRIRFYNGATQFPNGLEIYMLSPGTAFTSSFPIATVAAGTASEQSPIGPREYELTAVDFNTENVVYGPVPVTIEANRIYSMVFVNGASSATADVVLLDDFL